MRRGRRARGASKPQGAEKATEVKGTRVETALRETAPRFFGNENKSALRVPEQITNHPMQN
jgi:hypothetical protein